MKKSFDPVAALVAVLLADIAPVVLGALRVDPRAQENAGLSAARRRLESWTDALACAGAGAPDAADPLGPDALAVALRSAFVAAASRGRVVVERRGGATTAVLELGPHDLALVETIRELAVTLDAQRGSSVAQAFDAWRDLTLARIFGLARHRAGEGRRG